MGYDGLGCIGDDDLWDEMQRRDGMSGTLAERFLREAPSADLLAELNRRLPNASMGGRRSPEGSQS